jgi:dipeptidyl aminopeptidase/acylaminoacyl peptidase
MKRMMRRMRQKVLLGICLVTVAAAQPEKSYSILPLDLAFSAKTIRLQERPVVNRDGNLLAYEVYTPPERSSEGQLAEGVRFLPNGTPFEMVGLRTFIVPTGDGPARAICPEKANSWRTSPSPDGSQVAFFSDAGGMPQLWVYDVAKDQFRRVSEAPIKVKHWPGDEAAWSADGRELFVPLRPVDQMSPGAQLASVPPAAPNAISNTLFEKPTVSIFSTGLTFAVTPEKGAPTPTELMNHFIRENNAALAAIDVVTGKVRIVVPSDAEPRPSCLRLSPDGKWVSYLSVFKTKGETSSTVYYDLAVVPASGGVPILIATDLQVPERDYFEDTYRWLPGSKQIVFLKDEKLWIADVTVPGTFPKQIGGSLGKLEQTPLAVMADGRGVLVGQQAEKKKTFASTRLKALAIVPIDGSTVTTFSSIGEVVMADRDALWQPEPSRIVIVEKDEATSDRSIVSVDPRNGAKSILWKGRGRLNPVGSVRGESIVARFESVDTPPDFYRFDKRFVSKRRLTHIEPRLDGVMVSPMEIFESEIPGFDNHLQKVQTAVFLPFGKKAGDRLPAIVCVYAGVKLSAVAQAYGGGVPTNSMPTQVLTSRGYAVLLVDAPLTPSSKGSNPIQEMGDAILAQVYRAADLGFVDRSRLAIIGQSYGGYSTAAMITQTNLFKAAIAMDGIYDLAGNYAYMGPGGTAPNFRWSETGQGRMGTHPWADLRRYLANSPYYQADKINTPLLLIHGKKDEVCPVSEAEKMFNALKRLGKTAQLAVYEGEGHVPVTWSLVNALDATQRTVDWLQKYMSLSTEGDEVKP